MDSMIIYQLWILILKPGQLGIYIDLLEVDDTWYRKGIVAPDQRAENQYDQALGMINFLALVALQENIDIFSLGALSKFWRLGSNRVGTISGLWPYKVKQFNHVVNPFFKQYIQNGTLEMWLCVSRNINYWN